jgi:hypothetical protein
MLGFRDGSVARRRVFILCPWTCSQLGRLVNDSDCTARDNKCIRGLVFVHHSSITFLASETAPSEEHHGAYSFVMAVRTGAH